MRTYLILKEKVAQFAADEEIQGLLGELRERGATVGDRVTYSADGAKKLKERSFDLESMRKQGYAYERLDQLTMELLLGVR
jgi:xylose isomerase